MHALATSFYQFLHSSPQAPEAYAAGAIAIGWTLVHCYVKYIKPHLHPPNQSGG